MFRNCTKLKSLDASNWDTSKVTDMYQIFCMCYDLVCLDISGWNIENTYIHSILDATNSLMTVLMKNTNYTSVNKIISYLPIRESSNCGTLNISGVDNINNVDIATANSKYWTVSTSD
jgi:surface protein